MATTRRQLLAYAGFVVAGLLLGVVAVISPSVLDVLGLSLWVLATPPLVASVAIILWITSPARRLDAILRGVLIVSVGIAGIEAIVALLSVGFLWLFALSGGMEQF